MGRRVVSGRPGLGRAPHCALLTCLEADSSSHKAFKDPGSSELYTFKAFHEQSRISPPRVDLSAWRNWLHTRSFSRNRRVGESS